MYGGWGLCGRCAADGKACGVGCGGRRVSVRRWMRRRTVMCAALDATADGHVCGVGCDGGRACVRRWMRRRVDMRAALDAAADGHVCGGHSYAFRRRSVPDIGITSGN